MSALNSRTRACILASSSFVTFCELPGMSGVSVSIVSFLGVGFFGFGGAVTTGRAVLTGVDKADGAASFAGSSGIRCTTGSGDAMAIAGAVSAVVGSCEGGDASTATCAELADSPS